MPRRPSPGSQGALCSGSGSSILACSARGRESRSGRCCWETISMHRVPQAGSTSQSEGVESRDDDIASAWWSWLDEGGGEPLSPHTLMKSVSIPLYWVQESLPGHCLIQPSADLSPRAPPRPGPARVGGGVRWGGAGPGWGGAGCGQCAVEFSKHSILIDGQRLMLRPALPCPALPCPALPRPALPDRAPSAVPAGSLGQRVGRGGVRLGAGGWGLGVGGRGYVQRGRVRVRGHVWRAWSTGLWWLVAWVVLSRWWRFCRFLYRPRIKNRWARKHTTFLNKDKLCGGR